MFKELVPYAEGLALFFMEKAYLLGDPLFGLYTLSVTLTPCAEGSNPISFREEKETVRTTTKSENRRVTPIIFAKSFMIKHLHTIIQESCEKRKTFASWMDTAT
jgi:hypothetical protein